MKRLLLAFCLLLVTALPAGQALAQGAAGYPAKDLKWVVPFPPAGASDILARLLAAKLGEAWGKTVVVENNGAASGTVATEQVAKAPADGYTIILGTNSTHAINPAIFPNVKTNVVKDFAPIRLVATNTVLLAVHPSLPAKTLPELIAYAKANPGKLSYSSPANGTSPHIAMEWLKQLAGVDIVHAPYRGAAAAVTALLSGEVQVGLVNLPNAMPSVREGKMRVLAQAGETRHPVLPDAPTFVELGWKDYVVEAWLGVFMAAGTSPAITQKLSDELDKILKQPDVQAKLRELGLDLSDIKLDAFGKKQATDVALWDRMVKATGAKPD